MSYSVILWTSVLMCVCTVRHIHWMTTEWIPAALEQEVNCMHIACHLQMSIGRTGLVVLYVALVVQILGVVTALARSLLPLVVFNLGILLLLIINIVVTVVEVDSSSSESSETILPPLTMTLPWMAVLSLQMSLSGRLLYRQIQENEKKEKVVLKTKKD